MIIKADRLFDGEGFRENACVVIEEGAIVAVGGGADAPGGAGETVRCRFAMPGLVDSHAHAQGQQEGSPEGRPFAPRERYMEMALLAGVTTLRDMGNTIESVDYMNRWSDKTGGPRLFSPGPMLDSEPLSWTFSRQVESPDEAEREVDRLAAEGVHFVKVHRNVRPDIVAAVVPAAARHGLRVAVQPGATTAVEACRAGAHSIEHLVRTIEPCWVPGVAWPDRPSAVDGLRSWARVDLGSEPVKRFLDAVVEGGVWLCPLLLATRRRVFLDEAVNEPHLELLIAVMPYHRHFKRMRDPIGYAIGKRYLRDRLPYPSLDKAALAEVHAGWERLGEVLQALHGRGARLVVGSNSSQTPSVVPGFAIHREMSEWAALGIPAADILAAATSRGADLLGDDRAGRLRPGARADLVLLDKDPAENFRAFSSDGLQVVCRGRLVDRPAVRKALLAAAEWNQPG